MTKTSARPEVSHYTYGVTWSPEDGEFVATCSEFPALSWLAPSQAEALVGLERLISETVSNMEREGEEIPRPFSERPYSGKFNLRVGARLHRRLAMEAAAENLSLNQYVVRRLSSDG